jgi:replicative DNA helicase
MDHAAMVAMTNDAEAALVGAILLDSRSMNLAIDAGLEDRMFGNALMRAAFRTLLRLIGEGKDPDVVEVWMSLRAEGMDAPVDALHATTTMAVSGRNAGVMAARVVQGYQRREIVRAATQAHSLAMDGDGSPEEVTERIQELFAGIALQRRSRAPRKLIDVVHERLDRLQAAAEGRAEPVGWSLGVPALDALLGGGFRPGGLYILAARPSVGKSSFAESLSLHAARQGNPTLFLSQEMSSEEVADRAISHVGRVRYDLITQAKVGEDQDWLQMADAAEVLHGAPIWVDDEPALTLASIRRKALSRPGLRLLVVDYLQLCATAGKQNRAIEVGEISRGLKALAKELGIAVLALSQLNRDVEKRIGGRPVMSDLRDSGEIEQDADAVLFLWRLGKPVPGEVTRIGCAVEKNRQGRIGGMTLAFQGDTQTWGELSDRIDEPEPEASPGRGGPSLKKR